MPRPQVEVTSFLTLDLDAVDELWPLKRLPALEPHAPLARIYRHAGSWTDLCERRGEPRGVDRDEALIYLLAWCTPQANLEAVRDALAVSAVGKSWPIVDAARADIVDMLALDRVGGHGAVSWLEAHRLEDLYEPLVAAYLAVSREVEARIVVAQLADSWRLQMADCRTLYRARALLGIASIRDEIESRKTEPSCERVAKLISDEDANQCPLNTGRWQREGCTFLECQRIASQLMRCGAIGSTPAALASAVFANWPGGDIDPAVWMTYARFASGAITELAGEALVLTALENAALLIPCRDHTRITQLARELVATAPRLAPRLARYLDFTEMRCEERFSPTLDRSRP